jgi:hypothetical protein
MLDTTIVDQISDTQQSWLAQLKLALDKQRFVALPKAIFATFRARSWVDGDPMSCKLTAMGMQAAIRLLPDEKARKKKR